MTWERQRKETDVLLCAQEVDLLVQGVYLTRTRGNDGDKYWLELYYCYPVVDVKTSQILIDGFYVF